MYFNHNLANGVKLMLVRLTQSKNDSYDELENGSSESEASEYYVKIVPIQIHHISFIHMSIIFRNFIAY